MKTITVKNQKEYDSLPKSFDKYTTIYIDCGEVWLQHDKAWENSHVEARENSHVEVWGNSHVEARGNSHVEAWGNVGVWLYSDFSTVLLFMFAVCWNLAKGKIIKKSKTCTVIVPQYTTWFDMNAIEKKKKIILYKKVSKDFKTQENTKNETLWEIGSIVEHPLWEPRDSECGEGKFHACSRPYFTDEFRNEKGDKYIAIEVETKNTYEWKKPSYPHKIAFKKGLVLMEVDKFGNKI